jgi:hypothetical protein
MLPLGWSTTTGGPPVAAYNLLGVTRAAKVGVADDMVGFGVFLAAASDDSVCEAAPIPTAAITSVLTAPVTRFLWVFIMNSLGVADGVETACLGGVFEVSW